MFRKLLWVGLLLAAAACGWETDPIVNQTTEYTPVLMRRSDMIAAVRFDAPQPFRRPGKIYVQGRYLFVIEMGDGIHVIDNQNPAQPEFRGFIRVPGCVDVAVRGPYLYADNVTDLVVFDLSNPADPQVAGRVVNALPNPNIYPPDGGSIPREYQPDQLPADMIIVKWEKKS